MAEEGYHSLVAFLAFRDRWSAELSARQNHDQIGCPKEGTCLVVRPMGENIESFSQLQCSRKPSSFFHVIRCGFTPQLHGSGLVRFVTFWCAKKARWFY